MPRDVDLQQQGYRLPRSTKTVWKLLKRLGLIAEKPVFAHKEEPLREPLEEIQVDFKDPGIPADPSGESEKQHVVEVMNFVFLRYSQLSFHDEKTGPLHVHRFDCGL